MSTIANNTERGAASPVKSWIAAHSWPVFLAIFFAGVWIAYLPLVLSLNGIGLLRYEIPFPLELINLPASLIGPFLATVVVLWAKGGRPALRELRGRLFNWRVGIGWYAGIVLGVPLSALAVSAMFLGVDAGAAAVARWPEFLASYLPNMVLIAALVSMWEEGGLMGWAFPDLQRRFGPLAAAAILGPIWALMHLPYLLVHSDPTPAVPALSDLAVTLLLMSVLTILIRMLTAWIFNSTYSILLIALAHGAMNATHGAMRGILPEYSSDSLHLAFLVLGLLLLVLTRGRLAAKPGRVAQAVEPATRVHAPVV